MNERWRSNDTVLTNSQKNHAYTLLKYPSLRVSDLVWLTSNQESGV